MKNISVVGGAGYIGMVISAVLAERGCNVIAQDISSERVAGINAGKPSYSEPGLEEILHKAIRRKSLRATTSMKEAVEHGDIIYICVPTPTSEDGFEFDMGIYYAAIREIADYVKGYKIIINKSTVMPKTADKAEHYFRAERGLDVDVVANPEFLAEGKAIEGFDKPDRIVIASRSEKALKIVEQFYGKYMRRNPRIITSTNPVEAELGKCAINSYLAAKFMLMNELAEVVKQAGGNIDTIQAIVGSDKRIGNTFLYPGPGMQGPCFSKDTRALIAYGKRETGNQKSLSMFQSMVSFNEKQNRKPYTMLREIFPDVEGKSIAFWGLTFKKGTDDVRDAVPQLIYESLSKDGAIVFAHDPEYEDSSKAGALQAHFSGIRVCEDKYDTLNGADALLLLTDWPCYIDPDISEILKRMKNPAAIIDARNLFTLNYLERSGFSYERNSLRQITYAGIGRPNRYL